MADPYNVQNKFSTFYTASYNDKKSKQTCWIKMTLISTQPAKDNILNNAELLVCFIYQTPQAYDFLHFVVLVSTKM